MITKIIRKTILLCNGCVCNLSCEPFSPLQPSKTPETPNLSQICPSDCFGGFQSGGLKFGKICQNLSENYRFSNFDKFFQISVPLTGTPQNNCWDKFWTNLGFRVFLKAVRGEKGSQNLSGNSGHFCKKMQQRTFLLTSFCRRCHLNPLDTIGTTKIPKRLWTYFM